MNTQALIWFGAAVVFLLIEANTVALVSAWFCAGALAATATALLGGQIWLEVTVFFAVSAISLAALRPLAKRYFNAKVEKTNVDAVIGSVGTVLEPIDNIASTGRVKLGGMEWSARSAFGEPIAPGAIIRVERIEGVKVFVTPAKEKSEVI